MWQRCKEPWPTANSCSARLSEPMISLLHRSCRRAAAQRAGHLGMCDACTTQVLTAETQQAPSSASHLHVWSGLLIRLCSSPGVRVFSKPMQDASTRTAACCSSIEARKGLRELRRQFLAGCAALRPGSADSGPPPPVPS